MEDAKKIDLTPAPCVVNISRDLSDPRWDSFLQECGDAHHEQSSLWAQVKARYGWECVRFTVNKDREIVGGAQILKRRIRWVGSIGYLSRGPIIALPDEKLRVTIMTQLQHIARLERLLVLIVTPPYEGRKITAVLESMGFLPKPEILPPSNLLRATLILDLSQPIDAIMAGMRRTTRWGGRKGQREGIVVRIGNGDDVETFTNLMWALCKRRNVSPSPPQRDFFAELWRVFHPGEGMKIFMAEFDKKPVSAAVVFTFGKTARIWKVGWAGDHPERCPNHVLYWEAIKWAKENGYRNFDFVWIDKKAAELVLRGETVPASSEHGMAFFKLGFGGKLVLVPDTYCKFYHPLGRFFIRFGGKKVLSWKGTARAANLLWGKIGSGGE